MTADISGDPDREELEAGAHLLLPGPTDMQLNASRGMTHPACCAALAAEVLGRALPKDPALRLSDWEALPLSDVQQSYAALDAFASLRICQVCLQSAPTIQTSRRARFDFPLLVASTDKIPDLLNKNLVVLARSSPSHTLAKC